MKHCPKSPINVRESEVVGAWLKLHLTLICPRRLWQVAIEDSGPTVDVTLTRICAHPDAPSLSQMSLLYGTMRVTSMHAAKPCQQDVSFMRTASFTSRAFKAQTQCHVLLFGFIPEVKSDVTPP